MTTYNTTNEGPRSGRGQRNQSDEYSNNDHFLSSFFDFQFKSNQKISTDKEQGGKGGRESMELLGG